MVVRDHLRRAVLETLWNHPDGLSAGEVRDELAGRDLAVTTVITVLDRLRREGLVERRREGRAYRHRATATREEAVARLMVDALGAGGNRTLAFSHFVDSMSATDAMLLTTALSTRCACGPTCGCDDDCGCRGTHDPAACTAHA